MIHKARPIAMMLSMVLLLALTVMAIVVVFGWLNGGPIVDMRL